MLDFLFIRHSPYRVSAKAWNKEDGQKYRGTMEVRDGELVFEALDANIAFPLKGLDFFRNRVLGGAITFRHKEYSEWVLQTRNDRILNDPAFEKSLDLSRLVEKCGIYLKRTREFIKYSLLLLLIALVFFPSVRRPILAAGVGLIPIKYEVAMGEWIFEEDIAKKEQLVNDPELVQQFQIIATRIENGRPPEDRRFQPMFHIVVSPQINAFALPGGHIVVYSGLIENAATPEELAGILGHEMGHVNRRHMMCHIVQVVSVATLLDAFLGGNYDRLRILAPHYRLSSSRETRRLKLIAWHGSICGVRTSIRMGSCSSLKD